MSDSENQGAQWRYRWDDQQGRAVIEQFRKGAWHIRSMTLTAAHINDLETQLTTLKAQLEAAEGKAALADWYNSQMMAGVSPIFLYHGMIERYDALSAPVSDTGSEEMSQAERDYRAKGGDHR